MMEDHMKKLTPDDLQGLAGGYTLDDLSKEEMDEWNSLVNTWLDSPERGNPAREAMMDFHKRMEAKYG